MNRSMTRHREFNRYAGDQDAIAAATSPMREEICILRRSVPKPKHRYHRRFPTIRAIGEQTLPQSPQFDKRPAGRCDPNRMARARAPRAGPVSLKRDDFSSNRHLALAYCWSMIFSENRCPLFGIML